MENDIILKTAPFGFDKKSVMDFILDLQNKNEDLRRENARLTAELEELKGGSSFVETDIVSKYMPEEEQEITFEDLSIRASDLEMADKTIRKKPARIKTKTVSTKVKVQKAKK